MEDEVTLTLLSQRPMMFQYSEVEMQDHVSALETAVDDTVDHGLPPVCANMLRDIVFRTHLDVFRRGLFGDPPARVEPMTVRLRPGARAVRATPRSSPPAMRLGCMNTWPTWKKGNGVSEPAGNLRERGAGKFQGI